MLTGTGDNVVEEDTISFAGDCDSDALDEALPSTLTALVAETEAVSAINAECTAVAEDVVANIPARQKYVTSSAATTVFGSVRHCTRRSRTKPDDRTLRAK